MRSILLSSNTSFSFFYTTKWKLLYITIFLGLKHTGNFTTKKKSFLFSFHLWWSPCCDGLLCCWKGKSYCNLWDACLDLTVLTVPPNCANFDQTKKRSDSTSTQRGKVGCATISHFDSPWKSVKRSKEFLKLAYLDFYWRSKKRTAGNHEKGKSWKLRNLEYNCALKHKVSILAFLISYLFSFYSSSLLLELYP